jgi:hypothetical protein
MSSRISHLLLCVFLSTIALLMFQLFYKLNKVFAQGPSTFDSTTLYVRRVNGGPCELTDVDNPSYTGTMKDFITYSLPYEWGAVSSLEAYKAGAVAIRTFALNPRHHVQIPISNQTYRCVFAFQMLGFDSSPPANSTPDHFPLSGSAINQTNGIYMTHPQAKTLEDFINPVLNSNGAIDAQFRNETGIQTKASTDTNDSLYLKSIYDPISPPLTPQTGLGQNGSSRWAVGKSNFTSSSAPVDFPSWQSYQQILTHYYTGIQVVQNDGTGNITTLTPDFRWNMLVHQTNPLTPAPGSPFVATVTIQNSGVVTWPLNNNYPLSYWWVNNAGQQVTAPVIATRLAAQVGPGAVTTQTLNLVAPAGGPYTLTYRLTGPTGWTQPHYDAANTRANPTTGLPGAVSLLWRQTTDPANRLLADDTLLYGRSIDAIAARDLAGGLFYWSYPLGSSLDTGLNGALTQGRYITGRLLNGQVVALDTGAGTAAWSQTIGASTTPASPIAQDGRVYVATNSGSSSINVYNLEAVSGAIGWTATIGNPPTWQTFDPQTPAVLNNLIYLAHQSWYQANPGFITSLSVMSALNGSLLWTINFGGVPGPANAPCAPLSPPIVAGNRLFVGLTCQGYKVAAINMTTHQQEWLIDRVSTDPPFTSLEVVSLAYYNLSQAPRLLITGATKVWALNLDGTFAWSWQPPSGWPVRSKATIAGDRVWVAAGTGTNAWRWFALSVASGSELSSWTPPTTLGLPNSYPVISGNILLFTTATEYVALSIGSGLSTNWFDQLLPPPVSAVILNRSFMPAILKE